MFYIQLARAATLVAVVATARPRTRTVLPHPAGIDFWCHGHHVTTADMDEWTPLDYHTESGVEICSDNIEGSIAVHWWAPTIHPYGEYYKPQQPDIVLPGYIDTAGVAHACPEHAKIFYHGGLSEPCLEKQWLE